MEVSGYDSYLVRMDGSGRISKRNRKFLRPVRPYKDMLKTAESSSDKRGGQNSCIKNKTVLNTGKSREDASAGQQRAGVDQGGHSTTSKAQSSHYLPLVVPGDVLSDAVHAGTGGVLTEVVSGNVHHPSVHSPVSGAVLQERADSAACPDDTRQPVESSGAGQTEKDSASGADDLTNSCHTTPPAPVDSNNDNDNVMLRRSGRGAKLPSFLQVGDPSHPRFNRGRKRGK